MIWNHCFYVLHNLWFCKKFHYVIILYRGIISVFPSAHNPVSLIPFLSPSLVLESKSVLKILALGRFRDLFVVFLGTTVEITGLRQEEFSFSINKKKKKTEVYNDSSMKENRSLVSLQVSPVHFPIERAFP